MRKGFHVHFGGCESVGVLKFPCPFPERTFSSFPCVNFPFVCRKHSRNGKRRACIHRVMDARGRLLSTKEALSCSRCSREQLQLLECLTNLPSGSITWWLHSCNAYHFFYNIIKGENISICLRLSQSSVWYKMMYAVICPRVNKTCLL